METNYVAHYKRTEVKKKLNLLLLIAAFGTFLDGVVTLIGHELQIAEGNPVVNLIGGVGGSLLLRVAVIAALYWISDKIVRSENIDQLKVGRLIKGIWVYIFLVWGIVILNTLAVILVYVVLYA